MLHGTLIRDFDSDSLMEMNRIGYDDTRDAGISSLVLEQVCLGAAVRQLNNFVSALRYGRWKAESVMS